MGCSTRSDSDGDDPLFIPYPGPQHIHLKLGFLSCLNRSYDKILADTSKVKDDLAPVFQKFVRHTYQDDFVAAAEKAVTKLVEQQKRSSNYQQNALNSLRTNDDWHLNRKEGKSLWELCFKRALQELQGEKLIFAPSSTDASAICSQLAQQESHRQLFFDDFSHQFREVFERIWKEDQRDCNNFFM